MKKQRRFHRSFVTIDEHERKAYRTVSLFRCRCRPDEKRGPPEGVCGACGNAILSEVERIFAEGRL